MMENKVGRNSYNYIDFCVNYQNNKRKDILSCVVFPGLTFFTFARLSYKGTSPGNLSPHVNEQKKKTQGQYGIHKT